MNDVAAFVDIEDSWETEYLRDYLQKVATFKSFKESADLTLDNIKDANILYTLIN
jgi:CO dehydrogenase/acetyl-CoA synthase gamma subunit (corrinoid Fe-S protein)